ncbi:MAG: lipoate--protein ligase family protein [Calditrichaeota bacterium]|nr:MAG: lipoate--protein ligase family protein [Calditrichota bacterium]
MPQTLSESWRFIDSGAHSAYYNMATDLALLKNVHQPVLRFYSWKPWAISLGHHQDLSEINETKCARDKIDIVRRPTGGKAILHAEELTYCVVFPAQHPLQQESINAVYQHISEALLLGLKIYGANNIERTESKGAHKLYADSAACFSSSVNFEITTSNRKLIGSAQRRFKEGILQHGSLLTGPAHENLEHYLTSQQKNDHLLQNKAACLEDVLGFKPEMAKLKSALKSGFEKYFFIAFTNCELTAKEQLQAEKFTKTFQYGEVTQ